MKYKGPALIALFVVLNCLNLMAQPYGAEDNQPRLLKWLDDSHFLVQKTDSLNNTYVENYDCRTGKSLPVTDYRSESEILKESMPEELRETAGQVVSSDFRKVIFNRENDLWFFRVGDQTARKLTCDEAPEMNVRFSTDEKKIAYTKYKELYVYDLELDIETRLTFDASDQVYNGWASWIYYEEILGRSSRYAAFWWSPDGNRIAFLHTDETEVPVFYLNSLEDTDPLHGRLEITPYPKPGDPNPQVKIGIADVSTGKITWIRTDETIDQYLAWPSWTPDSRSLMIQVLNRDQNDLRFILADVMSGEYKEIYSETRPTWVEFYKDNYVFNDGSGFIVRSSRNDWYNLYYYGWDGKLISQVTSFNWKVTGIVRVDEDRGVVYFNGTGPDGLNSHLFRIGLNGLNLQQLTGGDGTHQASVSPGGSYVFDRWSTISDPGGINLADKKGKVVRAIYREDVPVFDGSKNQKTEIIRVTTSDGLFEMPVKITYPVNFDPQVKHPVIFSVYGGPDAGSIRNRWAGIKPSWYAEHGIVVVDVSHRGSGFFGKEGLDYMHRCLGKWEISDYSDVVKWLRRQSWVDPGRMGITGGSYGGYVTCLALTMGAEYWTHGIADFPVTDYRLYDDVYTERYMDQPIDNKAGYDNGSALTYAGQLKGKLLIRHGDMDDNVHMQNSIWLITRLQDLNKPFEFMVYPGERHGWKGPKRVFMTNEANNFWLREFFGKRQ